MTLSPSPYRNHLLLALSPTDLDLLRPHLEHVSLSLRQFLESPNEPIRATPISWRAE